MEAVLSVLFILVFLVFASIGFFSDWKEDKKKKARTENRRIIRYAPVRTPIASLSDAELAFASFPAAEEGDVLGMSLFSTSPVLFRQKIGDAFIYWVEAYWSIKGKGSVGFDDPYGEPMVIASYGPRDLKKPVDSAMTSDPYLRSHLSGALRWTGVNIDPLTGYQRTKPPTTRTDEG